MNLSVGFLIVLANAIAMHILLNRLNQTSFGSRFILESQAKISTIFNSHPEACGLSGWSDYAISSKRVFLPTGIRPATVHVSEGKVVGLSEYSPSVKLKTFNFGDALISPGFIDVHVHLDEPGRDEWEGITSGTAAAAVGGITTVVDMPLNNHPSTTSTALLKEKQAISQAKSHVDMGFWAGLVPGNAGDHEELASLIAHGAAGFKSFLCPSGINDFAHVGADDLAKALPFLKAAGVPLFVHAELASELPPHQGAPQAYRTYLDSRPPRFERDAITLLVQLLDRDNTSTSPGFHLHIAHLSDAKSLDIIMEAQRRHPITVETCPHYLMFAAEDIPDRATQFKCAPPIRPAANREDLLDGVARGAFFAVSSDHSPSHPSLKSLDTGDFMAAWGGISGLQYLLPAAWTALLARDVGIIRFTELMAENPAKMLGLERSKGRIAQGFDADFTVWDPEAEVNTSTAASQHKHKLSPYTNVRLQGKTLATVVRGNFVYLLSRLSEKPCGRPVHRA